MEIHISSAAIKRIKELLSKEPPSFFLRVSVLGGGCSGFQYNFILDDKRNADDTCFDADGVHLITDAVSLDFLQGSTIDFIEDLSASSFVVQNPKAKSSCGCGNSFSV